MLRASDPLGAFVCAKDDAAVVPLLLVHFNIVLYALGYWVTQPVLPFLSKKLGAGALVFGQLQTVFSVVQLVGNPVIGRICDVHGAKVALQMCQLATGLSYTLLGVSSDIPQLFLSRLPTVLMQSMHCAQAFVADLSPEHSRSAALGRLSLSYGAGMATGPLLGGLLSETFGYQGTALSAGGIMLLPILVNWRLLPKTTKGMTKSGGEGSLKLRECLNVMTIPACRTLTIFMMLTGLSGSIYHSTFSMAATSSFGMDAKQLGFVQTFSAVSGLVANTILVGLLDKHMSQTANVSGAVVLITLAMLAYTQVDSATHVMLIVAVMAVPSTSMYTTLTSMLTKAASADNTATVIGLGHAARSAVGIVGPSIGGYVLAKYGTKGVGCSCAVVLASALMFLQVFKGTLGVAPAPPASGLKQKDGGKMLSPRSKRSRGGAGSGEDKGL